VVNIEPQIEGLNHHTDPVTKQMLQSVVDKKRKLEKFESYANQLRVYTFSCLALFLIYLTLFVIQPNINSIGTIISIFLDNIIHLFIILLISTGYATVRYFDKKADKAEDEFHALRCEIISKSTDLWPRPTSWSEREQVFEIMKREYDINLYTENK
jgi:hypothetical protein